MFIVMMFGGKGPPTKGAMADASMLFMPFAGAETGLFAARQL